MVNDNDFEKSDTEIKTNVSVEELKYPQMFVDGGTIFLDDLNEKEMNDPQIKAMFERSTHKVCLF